MGLSADFNEKMMVSLLNVIAEKFDLSAADIEVTSIEVDRDEQKIRIEFSVTTTEAPAELAKNYFGLTGKVREALGSDWSGFFPVMTPKFHSGIHA